MASLNVAMSCQRVPASNSAGKVQDQALSTLGPLETQEKVLSESLFGFAALM